MEPLQQTWPDPIVGIEKIDAVERREGGKGKLDAAVACRAQPAIALVEIVDPPGIGGGELAAYLVGLGEGAAVIDQDDSVSKVGDLSEGGVERLDQKPRLLISGDDDGDSDRVGRGRSIEAKAGSCKTVAGQAEHPWLRHAQCIGEFG